MEEIKSNKCGDGRKEQLLKTKCTQMFITFIFNHQKLETAECFSIGE